jgi:hypothetical protein
MMDPTEITQGCDLKNTWNISEVKNKESAVASSLARQ